MAPLSRVTLFALGSATKLSSDLFTLLMKQRALELTFWGQQPEYKYSNVRDRIQSAWRYETCASEDVS